MAFRITTKAAFPDNLPPPLSARNSQVSSIVNDELNKTDHQTRNELSPVPMFETNFLSNQKQGSQLEFPDMPIERGNSANPTIKSSRGNSALKSEPITHAKGSTACTIQ